MNSNTLGRIDWSECNEGISRMCAECFAFDKLILTIWLISFATLGISIPFSLTSDIERNLVSFIIFYSIVGSIFIISFVTLIIIECIKYRHTRYENIDN